MFASNTLSPPLSSHMLNRHCAIRPCTWILLQVIFFSSFEPHPCTVEKFAAEIHCEMFELLFRLVFLYSLREAFSHIIQLLQNDVCTGRVQKPPSNLFWPSLRGGVATGCAFTYAGGAPRVPMTSPRGERSLGYIALNIDHPGTGRWPPRCGASFCHYNRGYRG